MIFHLSEYHRLVIRIESPFVTYADMKTDLHEEARKRLWSSTPNDVQAGMLILGGGLLANLILWTVLLVSWAADVVLALVPRFSRRPVLLDQNEPPLPVVWSLCWLFCYVTVVKIVQPVWVLPPDSPVMSPVSGYLTLEQLAILAGVDPQERPRDEAPARSWPCWLCGVSTLEQPCDADGTGETGMMWPPHCFACTIDDARTVRVEAFREKHPDAEIPLRATTGSGALNQSCYRMIRVRGGDPNAVLARKTTRA